MLIFARLDEECAPKTEIVITLETSAPLSEQMDKLLGLLKFSDMDDPLLLEVYFQQPNSEIEVSGEWKNTLSELRIPKRSKLILRPPRSFSPKAYQAPPEITTRNDSSSRIQRLRGSSSVRFHGIVHARTGSGRDMEEVMYNSAADEITNSAKLKRMKSPPSAESDELDASLLVSSIIHIDSDEDNSDIEFEGRYDNEWSQGSGDSCDDDDMLNALKSFDMKDGNGEASVYLPGKRGQYAELKTFCEVGVVKSLEIGTSSLDTFDDIIGLKNHGINLATFAISKIEMWGGNNCKYLSGLRISYIQGNLVYQTHVPAELKNLPCAVEFEVDHAKCETVTSFGIVVSQTKETCKILKAQFQTSSGRSVEYGIVDQDMVNGQCETIQMLGELRGSRWGLMGVYGSWKGMELLSIGCYSGKRNDESLFCELICREDGKENYNLSQIYHDAILRASVLFHFYDVPRWIPDHDRSCCKSCGKEFGLFLWRHHCRCCGEIFCSSCSSFLVVIHPSLPCAADSNPFTPQRVCELCYIANENADKMA